MKRFLTLCFVIIISCVAFPQTRPSILDIKDQPIVDVRQYGVFPDRAQDSSVKMQQAMDSASNIGAVLYIPPGSYTISATLEANNNLSLIGDKDVNYHGSNTPWASMTGAIFEFVGANNDSVFEIDHYKSRHTRIEGITIVTPPNHNAAAVRLIGGPYLTEGGTQGCVVDSIGVYRRTGGISPVNSSSTAILCDLTQTSPDGCVAFGWKIKNIYGYNLNSLVSTYVASPSSGLAVNFFNSNLIEDCLAYQCWRAIELYSDENGPTDNQIANNIIKNVSIQPYVDSGNTAAGLFCTSLNLSADYVFYNKFVDCWGWDLQGSGVEYSIATSSNTIFSFTKKQFGGGNTGIELIQPTVSDFIRLNRIGWDSTFRIGTLGTSGGKFVLSNNYTGYGQEDTTLYGAAGIVFDVDAGKNEITLCLGASFTPVLTIDATGTLIIAPRQPSALIATGSLYVSPVDGNIYYFNGADTTKLN